MSYTKTTWNNDTAPAINATNLNKIEQGIYDNDSAIATANTNIGDLTTLTTTAKTSAVSAINEVDSHADTNTTNIGDLTTLTTTSKSNVVSAINELDSLKATKDVATISSNGLMSSNDKLMLDNAILSRNSLTYSSNWNDARDTGYRLYNAWTGSGGSNRPTDTKCMGCVLVITDASGTTTTQIFFPFSSTMTPMYRWYNGNWESWKSF